MTDDIQPDETRPRSRPAKPEPEGRDPNAEPYAVRLRLKFSKQGPVRFLSHLDLLKCVERALRRSGLPVAYTSGFHPRIRIHFGPALALGHASLAEWMDIDMAEAIDPEEMRTRFNAALPAGFVVLAVRPLAAGARTLGALIKRARYRIELAPDRAPEATALAAMVEGLLAQQEIVLKKKNKAVNLRGFVEEVRVCDGSPPSLEMTLHLGPEGSVRPEDVLAALSPEIEATFVERVAMLAGPVDGKWEEP